MCIKTFGLRGFSSVLPFQHCSLRCTQTFQQRKTKFKITLSAQQLQPSSCCCLPSAFAAAYAFWIAATADEYSCLHFTLKSGLGVKFRTFGCAFLRLISAFTEGFDLCTIRYLRVLVPTWYSWIKIAAACQTSGVQGLRTSRWRKMCVTSCQIMLFLHTIWPKNDLQMLTESYATLFLSGTERMCGLIHGLKVECSLRDFEFKWWVPNRKLLWPH